MPTPDAFNLLREVLKSLEEISELTDDLPATDKAKEKIDQHVAKIAELCGKISERIADNDL